MLDLLPDSDYDIETLNSSLSSMSSAGSCDDRCSNFSRLSFDAALSLDVSSAQRPVSPFRAQVKPHRSSEPAWAAIRSRAAGAGELPANLGPRDFKLVRRIGSGDIGKVYLCRLRDEHRGAASEVSAQNAGAAPCFYAMKIVDKTALAKKKKLERAATEKKILRILDHPFLPTLYADFEASPHYSCVVMEYCSGGDLHTLRHRQTLLRFPMNAVRFYAAEVLLALEYLHMLGIVYRDLKPENILIRSDGHIMISDFDLSLQSTTSPILENASAATSSQNFDPPSDPSCLPDRLFRPRKNQTASGSSRRFVAEPVDAMSCSFVGTHEYVAPEVAAGRPHGSAVDWWAYGIFIYELIYGRTPFVGPNNESTLRNIVKQSLVFPTVNGSAPGSAVRDLISGLLVKEPAGRLGSKRGAADVKAHPFFKGLNFALLRSYRPPFLPGLNRASSCKERSKPSRFDYF